ncbi:hypothetical protein [Bradyrhizobium sp.]|uniref:hypothetical protein n=1 Tax=Bradyrhizobium sp. TaxID=376 RepID=UPI003C3CF379
MLADEGYYSGAELKACEDDGIKAYEPPSECNGLIEKAGRFGLNIVARNTLAALDQKPGVRIGQRQLRLTTRLQPIEIDLRAPTRLGKNGVHLTPCRLVTCMVPE